MLLNAPSFKTKHSIDSKRAAHFNAVVPTQNKTISFRIMRESITRDRKLFLIYMHSLLIWVLNHLSYWLKTVFFSISLLALTRSLILSKVHWLKLIIITRISISIMVESMEETLLWNKYQPYLQDFAEGWYSSEN